MDNFTFLFVTLLVLLTDNSSAAPARGGGGASGSYGRGGGKSHVGGKGYGRNSGGGGYSGSFLGFLWGFMAGSSRSAVTTNWGSGDYWSGSIPSAHMAAVNPISTDSDDWHVDLASSAVDERESTTILYF